MSTEAPQIEGLYFDPQAAAKVSRGLLELPGAFDKLRFAAKWAGVGAGVDAAQKDVNLGEGQMAKGWEIWKHPRTKKPEIRILGVGKQVLMFRPKALQQAINAIRGNL